MPHVLLMHPLPSLRHTTCNHGQSLSLELTNIKWEFNEQFKMLSYPLKSHGNAQRLKSGPRPRVNVENAMCQLTATSEY
jgi:hypothetical protein